MSKSITVDRIKLIAEMARQNITGEELAQKSGVSRCSIIKMRGGKPVWRTSVTDADGKTRQTSADPLNHCTSLDTPMDDEEGGATLGDLCADPAALDAMRNVDGRIYTDQLHKAIDAALAKLTREEADVIRRRFYRGQSMPQIATSRGISCAEVQGISQKAMRKLRSDQTLHRWYDEIVPRHR